MVILDIFSRRVVGCALEHFRKRSQFKEYLSIAMERHAGCHAIS